MSKYSIKNICLGLGLGLVISALLNLNTAQRHLTVDELTVEAKLHGMKLEKIETVDKDKIQSNSNIQATPIATPTPEAAITPTEAPEEIAITIKAGATSSEVADILVENKLIAEKGVFIKRLRELKRESRLQIGSYKISKDLDLDKIIEILTTVQY